MRARVFSEAPEDVQEAVAMLLWYLAKERTGRTPALYKQSVKRACRLLKVMAQWHLGEPSWILAKEWKDRLRLAGLDPSDPMRVINQRRWNLAWEQLRDTGTFRDDIARAAIATGRQAPKAEARLKAIAIRPRKARKTHQAEFKMPKLK